jgi:hypothetical protein
MSILSNTAAEIRSGVFHVVFLDAGKKRIGSGTAFTSRGCFVTNWHVFDVPANTSQVWLRQDGDSSLAQDFILAPADFERRRIVASPEGECDYAVVDVPELARMNAFRFDKIAHSTMSIGGPLQEVDFLARTSS